MLLLIVTRNEQGQCCPFACQVPQLEATFEVLTSIATSGEVLVSINLIDNGQHTVLPPEAFDGEPIVPHIQKLEADWQALLNEPVGLQSVYQLLTDIACRINDTYLARIDRLKGVIRQTERSIQGIPQRSYLEDYRVRLELQLTRYRWQLDQAQAGYQRVQERLAPYLDCE